MKENLNSVDLSFLALETKTRPQVIGVYCNLKGIPNKSILESNILDTIRIYPRMKCCHIDNRWEEAPGFDLDNHFSWLSLPSARSESDLNSIIPELLFEKFADQTPPWKIIVLVGETSPTTEATPCSIILKVHHSWADGVGGMEILHNLCSNASDGKRSRTPRKRIDSSQDTPQLNIGEKLRAISRELLSPTADLGFTTKQTSLRRVGSASFDNDEFHAIKRITHANFNAIFLGIVSAGLAKYRLMHQSSLRSTNQLSKVKVIVPLNLRKAEDRFALGNHLTAANIEIPCSATLSLNTINEISEKLLIATTKSYYSLYSLMASFSSILPKWLRSVVLVKLSHHSHFICTFVRNPITPQHLAGAEILSYYAYPALMPGHSLGFAFSTYNKRIFMAVDTDANAIPDPDLLISCMVSAKNELLAELDNSRS